jgi:hypothetical protein
MTHYITRTLPHVGRMEHVCLDDSVSSETECVGQRFTSPPEAAICSVLVRMSAGDEIC